MRFLDGYPTELNWVDDPTPGWYCAVYATDHTRPRSPQLLHLWNTQVYEDKQDAVNEAAEFIESHKDADVNLPAHLR